MHCVVRMFCNTDSFLVIPQLFRRVAAALPGMDSTPEKSKEDSIFSQKGYPRGRIVWSVFELNM